MNLLDIYMAVDHAGNLHKKLADSDHSIPGQCQVATCGIFAHVSAQKGLFSLELWVLAGLSSLLDWLGNPLEIMGKIGGMWEIHCKWMC